MNNNRHQHLHKKSHLKAQRYGASNSRSLFFPIPGSKNYPVCSRASGIIGGRSSGMSKKFFNCKTAAMKKLDAKLNPSKLKKPNWSLGLVTDMNNPKVKLQEDDFTVVLKDKFPKARHHILVLPKKDIPSLSKVTMEDLELLHHMEKIAKNYANLHKDYEFQIGYHAIPSMERLHLHVISKDFDSPCLKTMHHWNTFNTPYFISAEDVFRQLKEYGKIEINEKENVEYLKRYLKCHKCEYVPKDMWNLKKHLHQHISPTNNNTH